MSNNEAKWENYGDVNPLEHGGIFVLSDKEKNGDAFEGCYYIEKVNRCPDTGRFIVDSLYVNVNDSWIDKDAVIDCCDTPNNDEIFDEVLFAIDCTYYYNPLNFGNETIIDTEREVKEYFKEIGIEL